jgi:hypothetical protein
VHPVNEPEPEVVECLVEAWEGSSGLLQLDIDVGDMASPRMAKWPV